VVCQNSYNGQHFCSLSTWKYLGYYLKKYTVTLSINVNSGTRLPLSVTGAASDGSSLTLTHTHTHIHTEYARVLFYLIDNFSPPLSCLSLTEQPTKQSPLTRDLKWRRGMTNDDGLINIYICIYKRCGFTYTIEQFVYILSASL
jgi:hypothetical protein